MMKKNAFNANDENRPKYAIDQPYAPAQVTAANSQYAALLMNSYASAFGEFTTINTYNYQSIMLQQKNSELSTALQQIAIVEMHHLRLLGQTIFLLGGNPRFMGMQKKQPIYWQGRMVDYNTDLKHLLQRNANAEQYTIDTYQHDCTIIDDPYIVKMLEHFIADEEIHLRVFNDYLNLC